MTQKEIYQFLDNTKVYVNGKSKKIQEKLFSLGYCWHVGGRTEVEYEGAPFIFIHKTIHSISCTNNMIVFTRSEHREISAEEILSIELTESNYRPFKNDEECWKEMLKHKPFGWLKNSSKYLNIISICNAEIEFVPEEVDNDNDIIKNNLPFNNLFQTYTFADDTPFGIKEE